MTDTDLTERELSVLDVAGRQWHCLGCKENHVVETLGLSLVRYDAAVNRLLDDPRAEAYDGQLVNRLRRLRQLRRENRSNARLQKDGGR